MDIKLLTLPIVRWWKLLLAATLLAAISSYIAVAKEPLIYQAHATLMVGQMIQDPNPNSSEFYLAEQLATTYVNLANRDQIKEETMKALGLQYLPEYSAQVVPSSPLIEILVNDTDPKRAQAVANEVSNQLIVNSPTGSKSEENSRRQFINGQLDLLQTQIEDTQKELEKLQQQLGTLNSSRQINDMQTQIAALQQKRTTLQTTYADILSNTQKGAANTLTLIEPAELPTSPIGPKKLLTVGLASILGLAVATLAAFGMDFFDETFKTTEEITHYLKAPVLGSIGEMPKGCNSFSYFLDDPRSPFSDSFRMLRTNLTFLGIKNKYQTILVTSSGPSEGKSTIAANLAACLAHAEKKVILVDADLRKPSIHAAMGVQNKNGLSDICLGSVEVKDVLVPWGHENLQVVLAGTVPPNPVELLESERMISILGQLKALADYVIIDCPPLFLADTMVLSTKSDGVLLVVSPGYTRKKMFDKLVAQVQKAGINLLGIVFNRIPEQDVNYLGHYYRYRDASLETHKESSEASILIYIKKAISFAKRIFN